MSGLSKRFVSELVANMMVIALVPTQAFAASEDGSESESLVSAGSLDLDFVDGTDLGQAGKTYNAVVGGQT